MANVWIKNPHVSNTINYQGQDILAGEYHLIPVIKLPKWQSDIQLIKDIVAATPVAIVAMDDSGNSDITDISDALDYLKDKTDAVQKQQIVVGEDIIQTYEEGVDFSIPNGTTVDVDLLINFKYLRGGLIEVDNHKFPTDNISVKVVDKDDVLGYGAGVTISEYLKAIPMKKDGQIEINSGNRSKPIPAGLYFRLTYASTGTTDVVGGLTLYGSNDA